MPNKVQINFEVKLRNYKNLSGFLGSQPWTYPAIKEFTPAKQWESKKKDTALLNPEYKTKFTDTFKEKNLNEIIKHCQGT